MLLYNLSISREVNFRRTDFTSIYNYQNIKLYLKRLKNPEGDSIFKSAKLNKYYYKKLSMLKSEYLKNTK